LELVELELVQLELNFVDLDRRLRPLGLMLGSKGQGLPQAPGNVTTLDQRVAVLIAALGTLTTAAIAADFARIEAALLTTPGRLGTLLALTLALQFFTVRVYGRGSVSVSAIGILTSVFLLDTGPAMAIAAVVAAAQWLRTRPEAYKCLFDVSNYATSAGVASLVFQATSGSRLAAAVLAGCTYAALNTGILCLAMSLSENASWRAIWAERFHWARFHFALFGPLAYAATIAYQQIGLAGLFAFSLPPALMMLSMRQYLDRTTAAVEEVRQANVEIRQANRDLRRAHRDTIAALSRSMEAKDLYTGGHTERVATVAVALARELGFKDDDLEAVEIGALLHDIGKIGVPEHILRKAAPLDEDEWKVVKRHPVVSDYILSELDLHPFVRQCARSSHERIDGDGYPDGLSGEEIPLPARIVLVADALDALTTARPYRPARPLSAALAEIRANAGTQFCPHVVEALEKTLHTRPDLLVSQEGYTCVDAA
jgi:putative nucleotidyltransferase with HDIG domain